MINKGVKTLNDVKDKVNDIKNKIDDVKKKVEGIKNTAEKTISKVKDIKN